MRTGDDNNIQLRIILFAFLFLQKIRLSAQVSFKVKLRLCIIIPDVCLKFSAAFQNIEAAFKRCSTKEVVQQNDTMKYSSSATVVKSRKALVTFSFTKSCTLSQVFCKEFDLKLRTAVL